jgi:hypothetical protein
VTGKLPTGTRVRALRDLDVPTTRPFHVDKGEVGRIVAVGPDAAFGWYGVAFDDDRQLLCPVAPAAKADAMVEVIE